MDVKKISDDIRVQKWMAIIKECSESGQSVRRWCKENNIAEPTYYSWLKKLRTLAVENGAVEVPSFVPVPIDQHPTSVSTLVISKGDIHIEFPTNTEINTIMNIIKVLLC